METKHNTKEAEPKHLLDTNNHTSSLSTKDQLNTITISPNTDNTRPTPPYDPAAGKEICERIARDESLLSICKDEHIPSKDTIYRWLLNFDKRPELIQFGDDYSRARAEQPEATYERLIQLEHDVLDDKINPNAARVALLSMQWRMGKMKPKKYGDVKQLDVSGGIDLNIFPANKPINAGTSGDTQIEHKPEAGAKELSR